MKQKNLNFWHIPLGMVIAVAFLALLMCSCKSVEYVTVPQQHTEHHWHTDSVHTIDSVFNEKETVVMQLDSAEMARYGIQLKQAERAWLVRTKELERQIQQLMQQSQSRDTVRDSIPVPYPVEKLVEKQLSKGQMLRLAVGDIAIFGVCGVLVFFLVRLWLNRNILRL